MIYFKVPVRMSKWKVEGRDGKGEERARAVNVYGRTLRAFMRADQNREHTMEPNGSKVAVIPEKDVMSRVERMAEFVERVRFEALGPHTCQQLKMSILDSLGCAIGALASEPTRMIRAYIDEFGNHGHCTLIGGGVGDIDRAALYNSALIRYLDFNDSYLAKGETCHPSDNLGAILAAGEWAESTGRDLMTALAIAYQIQCRLSELVPVRARGFDHTVQGEYAVTAGISKVLGLSSVQTANAIAISGTAFNALRVTRTGKLSHWKAVAYPNLAACCTRVALLARQGITGPLEAIEGEKGLMDAITGFFEVSWDSQDLGYVGRTILKKYNAEIHSQTAIEAVLTLRQRYQFTFKDIERVKVEIFDVAYNIIGGGEEGDKSVVSTKEQADHSLPYVVAVALIDGQVMPEQYKPERIQREDVQKLLRAVSVEPRPSFSKRFPKEMPCRVEINLKDGRVIEQETSDYEGFFTRPMSWEMAVQKFNKLAAPDTTEGQRAAIAEAVANLEQVSVRELMKQLGSIQHVPDRQEF
jgi:2-methylcitrate dehydratase